MIKQTFKRGITELAVTSTNSRSGLDGCVQGRSRYFGRSIQRFYVKGHGKFSFGHRLYVAALVALALCAATVTHAAQDNTGPIPDSPSLNALTVDNNIEYAQTVLSNHRPWEGANGGGDDDYYYRWIRDGYKVPLKFTWDRSYAEFITSQQVYLWSVIENVCEKTQPQYDPKDSAVRYIRAKQLKIKEWHFTTTNRRANGEDRYAGAQGYIMSWNPATGVLTCAISVPGKVISNFRGEDITNFINDKIK